MTRVRSGRVGVRIPARARDFSVLKIVKTGPGAHPASYLMVTGIPTLG
jgi:hypothetical protein